MKDNNESSSMDDVKDGVLVDIFRDTLLEGSGIPKSIIEETDQVEYAKIETMNRDKYDLFIRSF